MPDTSPLTTADALAHMQTLPPGATLLLLGAPDTGKTTWAAAAVRALLESGKTVAVLDCDLGQSEIGPPGTVGAALAEPKGEAPPRALRDLSPLALYFVGATSPARHALDWCVGACQMARVAKKRRPDLLLVDTCGWTQGAAAVTAKRRLCELLLPHAVYAFTRGAELNPLLHAFAHLSAPTLHRIAPSPEVGRKTPAARSTRRAARFLSALDGAREITLPWDAVALLGTRLGSGDPLPRHIQQFIGTTLRLPTLHAETLPGGEVYAVVNGERWDASGLAALEGHFHTSAVTVVPAQRFAGLYVGLVSASGALLDIGLLARLDFDARTITLRTPCRRPAAIAQVWCGTLRLRPDGRERGDLRPGEI